MSNKDEPQYPPTLLRQFFSKDRLDSKQAVKDTTAYLTAVVTGVAESFRTKTYNPVPSISTEGKDYFIQDALHNRATEGLRGLIEQHTGNETLVALGFLGSDIFLQTIDEVSRKLGKKGLDPEIRFVASTVFGMAAATYLEGTKAFGNVTDFPGDLLGVFLGGAYLLTSRLMAKQLNKLGDEEYRAQLGHKITSSTIKLKDFTIELANRIKEIKDKNDPLIPALADKMVKLLKGDKDDVVKSSVES